ncbi:hypothetical protein EVAR_8565_1 [Eumeta japonica]|uniref:Uncharacterized protein n=1 Tax=Eumeta variegata TaxID=151549 RepID=A0A4C1TXU5_EUMVA|nr:hypothetical protein EVAR_8565_1 [Eumeta japonica]
MVRLTICHERKLTQAAKALQVMMHNDRSLTTCSRLANKRKAVRTRNTDEIKGGGGSVIKLGASATGGIGFDSDHNEFLTKANLSLSFRVKTSVTDDRRRR